MILYDAKLSFSYESGETIEFVAKEVEFCDDSFTSNTWGVGESVKRIIKIHEEATVRIVSDELIVKGISSIILSHVVPSVDSSLRFTVTELVPQFVHFTVLNSSKSLFCYRKTG